MTEQKMNRWGILFVAGILLIALTAAQDVVALNLSDGLVGAWGSRGGGMNCSVNWVAGGENLSQSAASAAGCNSTIVPYTGGSSIHLNYTSGQWFTLGNSGIPTGQVARTVCYVYRPASTSIVGAHRIMRFGSNNWVSERSSSTMYFTNNSGFTPNTSLVTSVGLGGFTLLCTVDNGTVQQHYVNNTNTANGTIRVNIASGSAIIGEDSPSSSGDIGYLKIWNRSLNAEELAREFNNGSFCDYSCTFPPSYPVLMILTNNSVNGSSISGFCANISNSTYTNYACNTTGTIVTFTADNSTNQSNSSLYLNLTNASYFNGSALGSSPSAILASLNGKTLRHGNISGSGEQANLSAGAFGNGFNIVANLTAGYIEFNLSFNASTADTTVCLWYKPLGNNSNDSSTTQAVFYDYPGGAPSWGLTWKEDTQRFEFQTRNSSTSSTSAGANNGAPIGSFRYVCGVLDRTAQRQLLYVNGSLNDNDTLTLGDITGTVLPRSGKGTATASSTAVAANGTFDEIRVWNASLNASEIQAEMNSAFPVRGKDLVASYSFELNNITAGAALNTTADTNYLVNGSFSGEGAYYFDGVDDYVRTPSFSLGSSNFTVSFSFNSRNTFTTGQRVITKQVSFNPGNTVQFAIFYPTAGNLGVLRTDIVDDTASNRFDTTGWTNETWNHYTMTFSCGESNVSTIYRNGAYLSNKTYSLCPADNNTNVSIGTDFDLGQYYNGSISHVQIYNRSLSAFEVRELYQRQYLAMGNYNITVFNVTGGGSSPSYFNQTQSLAWDTNENLTLPTYQALLTITGSQLFTGNTLTGFNVSNNLAINTTAGTSLVIPANNGTNTITFNHTGNYSKSQSCTATSLTTTACVITGIFDDLYTIGARSNTTTSINAFTVQVTNTTLNSTSVLYNTSTTNGSIIFPLVQGYYYLFDIQAPGYAYTNATLAGNASTQTYNFTLFTTNSYNISFYDEQNGSLINYDNITIDFISDDASYTRNTSNGTLYIDLITPGNYTLRYRGTQYLERFYQLTLTNNTYNRLNLTLLKVSTGTNVTVNVIDNINRDLEGAIVKVLKYDIDTNEYTINQIIETNFEGQGEITVTLNTEYYQFIIEYEGEVVLTTDPTYVYGTTLTFQVNPGSSGFEEALTNPDLSGTISFNNNTGVATFTFNDETNTATQGCIYAYEVAYNGQELLNTSCTSASTGTAAITITPDNTTYLFRGYMTHGGNQYAITELLYSYAQNAPVGRMLGLIITLILMVVLIFVARYSLEMAIVLGSMAPLLMSIAHLHSISIQASVAVFVLGLVTAYIVAVKK